MQVLLLLLKVVESCNFDACLRISIAFLVFSKLFLCLLPVVETSCNKRMTGILVEGQQTFRKCKTAIKAKYTILRDAKCQPFMLFELNYIKWSSCLHWILLVELKFIGMVCHVGNHNIWRNMSLSYPLVHHFHFQH